VPTSPSTTPTSCTGLPVVGCLPGVLPTGLLPGGSPVTLLSCLLNPSGVTGVAPTTAAGPTPGLTSILTVLLSSLTLACPTNTTPATGAS
jgi:hypothetical protein